jgi:hypothetical protein
VVKRPRILNPQFSGHATTSTAFPPEVNTIILGTDPLLSPPAFSGRNELCRMPRSRCFGSAPVTTKGARFQPRAHERSRLGSNGHFRFEIQRKELGVRTQKRGWGTPGGRDKPPAVKL